MKPWSMKIWMKTEHCIERTWLHFAKEQFLLLEQIVLPKLFMKVARVLTEILTLNNLIQP
jgi:hypothetical protein